MALPVYEGDNSVANVPNASLKMLQDLFSRKDTASMFFTNDLKVLLDIVLRELLNLDHKHAVCFLRPHLSLDLPICCFHCIALLLRLDHKHAVCVCVLCAFVSLFASLFVV